MFKKIVWLGFKTKWKNATSDIEAYINWLVEHGADEFFTGYNPPYWHEKYGFEVSPNGRFSEHEQITDFESLAKIVEEVHKYKNKDGETLEIFINANAWYYTDLTMPLIEKMLKEAQDIWVDWVIVGNVETLEYLMQIGWKKKINISTIMVLYSKEAIRFFIERYPINKVIFGREVTLAEIEDIVTSFPEIKFEVWGEGDFCRYNNGLCFAEHKYSSRDICTMVVNDLIIKKSYNPAFKKIALDENMTLEEKLSSMDDTYTDPFERIREIFSEIELDLDQDKNKLHEELIQIVKQNKDREDLYFEGYSSPQEKVNKNIMDFYKAVKYANANLNLAETELEKELKNSIQSGLKFYSDWLKKVAWKSNMKAEELNLFYNRSDALNLFNVAFFSKFPNVVTMKFPTRWRNYSEKLQKITDVFENWNESVYKYLDKGSSIRNTYYDQSYIFWWDKLWFRKMMKGKIYK